MKLGRLALVALIALAGLRPGHGQEQEPEQQTGSQQSIFFENIEVNVVEVEVYVTDKKGDPVTGLTREDFELYEDDKLMPISNFYAVEERKVVRRISGDPSQELPEQPVAPEEAGLPENQQLHLIIYVDNFNIMPFNRNRVFRSLREFLRTKVERGDRVMLVSYDRSLHIRREFTTDPAVVAGALYDLEKLTGHRVHYNSERRDLMRDIEDADYPYQIIGRVEMYAESVMNDLQFTIGALKDFVDTLAGIPGRKALLYVSDGLPMRAAEEMFYAIDEKFRENASGVLLNSLSYDATRRFRDLTAHANANRVTFYTVDAAGLRVSSSISAENATAGFSPMIDSIAVHNMQSSIMYMADQTGGRAIINTNNVSDGLERIAHDFNTFYSLGYTPAHRGDGRFHRVKVELTGKRKGLQVRFREGYRDKSTAVQMADGTRSSLHHGYQNNPLGIELNFGRASRREKGHYVVPLVVRIPLGKVVLLPQGEVHEARVRLWVAARDEEGRMSEVQETALPIQIPSEEVATIRDKYYAYEMSLLMRQGVQRVAVGVYDDLNSSSSFIARSVSVGS